MLELCWIGHVLEHSCSPVSSITGAYLQGHHLALRIVGAATTTQMCKVTRITCRHVTLHVCVAAGSGDSSSSSYPQPARHPFCGEGLRHWGRETLTQPCPGKESSSFYRFTCLLLVSVPLAWCFCGPRNDFQEHVVNMTMSSSQSFEE